MSYVWFADDHENGRLTDICKRLASEIQLQSGERFDIFQDRNDVAWGEQWQQRIDASLDGASFLIPIITPGFFKSPHCRREFERFVAREQELGRDDLILPIYYFTAAQLEDDTKRSADTIATALAGRQHIDWRKLRFASPTSGEVGRTLERMAKQIVDVMDSEDMAERRPPRAASARDALPMKKAGAPAKTKSMQPAIASPRSEPPTRIVDPMHRGDHATIIEALEAARPGDRIVVRPGLYRGGLHITKPVEIVGDGDVAEIVIEASGADGILFDSAAGRISNITVRQLGGGEWYGIDIAQGRLDLEGCVITSRSLACIAIHDRADPRVRHNRVHDGANCGIFVYEDGQGTIEDNEIVGCSVLGIELGEGSNATFRRNRIIEGGGGGVLVHDRSVGLFEDNDIRGHALTCIEVKTGGDPTFRRNRIMEGRNGGVLVHEGGVGLFEDNDVRGHAFAGVEVRATGNPVLRRNRISENQQGGVFVQDGGAGHFEDNDILDNALTGVEVKTTGRPTVRRNRIHRNLRGGVYIHDGGTGLFEGNDVTGNPEGAWDIEEACLPFVTLRDNTE